MTAGSRGYECRLGMTGTPGPGSFSYRAGRDIYGSINPWMAVLGVVVIVAAVVIPTLVLHSSPRHPKKAPVPSSTSSKPPPVKTTFTGNTHETAKLSVTLSASPTQIHTQPDINGFLLMQSGAPALNTYNATSKPDTAVYEVRVSNNGNVPLSATVLHVSATVPVSPFYGGPGYSPYGRSRIYCPGTFLAADGSMACYVGSKGGYMAAATSDTLVIEASYNQPVSGYPLSSLVMHVSVSGIAPDGRVVTATASPVSVGLIPLSTSLLHIQLSFQPDPVAKNQWFDLIVTLTNESTTSSIRYVAVQVPGTPGLPPKGFPDYSRNCNGVSSTWSECLLNPYSQRASMLAPGASRTLDFAEIVPGPGYPASSDINLEVPQLYTQQDPGEVEALGELSSGVVVYATATGYVNIS